MIDSRFPASCRHFLLLAWWQTRTGRRATGLMVELSLFDRFLSTLAGSLRLWLWLAMIPSSSSIRLMILAGSIRANDFSSAPERRLWPGHRPLGPGPLCQGPVCLSQRYYTVRSGQPGCPEV